MRAKSVAKGIVAASAILAASLLVYRGILFVPGTSDLYPWASDTLGHVIKAEYLRAQIETGHLYPDLFPSWYVGVQMLRYYPPLPYYLLVGLTYLIDTPVAAANWFIALCAFAGGMGWLLYRRWTGWIPALVGGLLYLLLPDNVRVAMAEGNLPRVAASALLPYAVYLLFRSLEGARWHCLALALCFAALVLCHAMMAAIYAASGALLALLCWLSRVTSIRRALLTIVGMALGVMLSGWWLLPSLTGGITELDQEAMTEALAVFSLTTYMNPLSRSGDPEIVYPGAVLLVAAVVMLFLRTGRTGWTTALTLTGLFGVLISTYGFNALFNALPLHHLFWPLRFVGVATFALLLALLWRAKALGSRWLPVSVAVLALLVADGALSLPLIHLRPARTDVVAVAETLRTQPGWRQATLDYSRLGSLPSYLFTAVGGREQIYGWAYQGARTARNVAAINEALRRGYDSYVLDRLDLFGVDDVVLLREATGDPDFPDAIESAGYALAYQGDEVTLYHRDGGPRAYRAAWRALGIGRGAHNLTFLFPQLIVGTQTRVDEYSVEELAAYDTVFLSGFEWRSRERAEEIVQQVSASGVQVVVDLTGTPMDPLAREPRFLEVWGEPIFLPLQSVRVEGADREYVLQPFDSTDLSWKAHTPQGLDVEVLHYDYLGAQSVALGYNEYSGRKVWFVGLNLPYHAAVTGDPAAVSLLAELLHLSADSVNEYEQVDLLDYQPSESGYDLTYDLDESTVLVVPIADHDGTEVQVDGNAVQTRSFENLVAFSAPAGLHSVSITVETTSIYTLGWILSAVGVLGLVGLALAWDKEPLVRWNGHGN